MYIIKAHETKTALMSHLQIYYEKLILKHAWLNFWDKHMTTGRINQVFNWLLTPELHPKDAHRSTTAESNRKLVRMSHTSPDKAPNAALTDCTQYKSVAAQSLPAEHF